MRIIFAGTPAFAASHLQSLIDAASAIDIVAVYTQPDRPAGRGKKLQPSPVKKIAEQAGLPVQQPISLKGSNEQQILRAYNADLMVVVAYGLLLPEAVLNIPQHGCINVHASILPRWRGAAPIERAILAGDKTTGITIMQMDAGLDTGDMLSKISCDITNNETGDSLRAKLVTLGCPALLETLNNFANRTITAEKQNDEYSTYAKKLNKSEAEINWQESAELIERKIRALTSSLSTHTFLNGQRIRIHEANLISCNNSLSAGTIFSVDKNTISVRCGSNALAISSVQIPGGKAMTIQALLNGKPDFFQTDMHFS